jgi:hypothetical protein
LLVTVVIIITVVITLVIVNGCRRRITVIASCNRRYDRHRLVWVMIYIATEHLVTVVVFASFGPFGVIVCVVALYRFCVSACLPACFCLDTH